jgi:hypothetical protein
MKPLKSIVFVLGIAVAGVLVGILASHASARLLSQSNQAAQQCPAKGINHRVTISHDRVSQPHVLAARCDSLTITNQDQQLREIAFGAHYDHQAYDGVTEKTLGPGQGLTVSLIQTGSFSYHDHAGERVQGDFTVNP